VLFFVDHSGSATVKMPLIEHLIDELNISRQQAEGGAGLLLRQAQTRLSPDDFLRVAGAIPAVSDLIGKAPRQIGPEVGPLRVRWQCLFSGWGELAPLRSACEGLGLDRAAIDKFVAVIGSHFREQSGPEVESLLLGTWR